MPETAHAPRQATLPPLGLRVATLLCWTYGILLIFGAFIALTFTLNVNRPNQPLLVFGWLNVATGAAYCVAGYLLKRRHILGGLLAGALAVFFSLFQAVVHTRPALAGFAGNLAILAALVVSWRHLKPPLFRKVGA